jgi:glycosyltransferase involved in cell wall biosynthesis
MPKLSVIIPAYNEEDGIAEIVERVLAVRPALAQAGIAELECLVVDDGSKDRTAEIVRGYPEARLIMHQRNQGYGAAIKTGFCHATGDLLAFLDADSTYPPELFPQLCRRISEGADLVVGSRMGGSESEMPLVRKIGNTFFAALLSLVSGVRISDSASGMRVLRREVLAALYPLPDGLNFTPAMSTRALHENLVVVEEPIPYSERSGRSKLSVVHDGMRFLRSIVWTALTYNPARIFGSAAALLIVLATAIALTALPAEGLWNFPRLFGALLLGVCGMMLFSTGTLFNYLVSLFHHRQIRQGLFGRPLFRQPLERHFGWIGLLATLGSLVLYIAAVAMRLTGPDSPAPWFPPVLSALLTVIGIQLISSWFLGLLLRELSQRASEVREDLEGSSIQPQLEPLAAGVAA